VKVIVKNMLGAVIAATLVGAVSAGGPKVQAPEKGISATKAADQSRPSDRFIVQFRAGTPQFKVASARQSALTRAAGAFGAKASFHHRMGIGADVIKLDRKLSRVAAEEFVRQLKADPSVEYAQIDELRHALYTPNDTFYASNQWHYFDAVGGLTLPAAWDLGKGSGVVVAVIDTGITAHPDLDANIITGYDFISDESVAGDGADPGGVERDSDASDPGDYTANNECGGGVPGSDSSWHGTHVAGTVAAVTNNGVGVAGVASEAKVMPVRALGHCGGYTSDIADAIEWASGGTVGSIPVTTTPAEVINMSLGGGGSCDAATQTAINNAVGRGTVVVVAAGNDNDSAEEYSPASCNNVITVASGDQSGARSSFSNAGNSVDILAPGGDPGIASTLNDGTTTPGNPIYAAYQGTSMASPHVAGIAAMMLGRGVITPDLIEARFKVTGSPVNGANCPGGCGYGRIDPYAAMQTYDNIYPLARVFWLNNGVDGLVATGVAGTIRRFYNYSFPGAGPTTWQITGGTGNLDLFVKFGSPPTTASYDCRSVTAGTNNESCTINTPQTGTYYAMAFSRNATTGAKIRQTYQTNQFVNKNDINVPDQGTADSTLVIAGQAGNAPATLKVKVSIYHSYVGDLDVWLVAPDGTLYQIVNDGNGAGSADSIVQEFTVNASSEVANGTWRLRATDNADVDVGQIDEWKLTF
jgi:serine protease